MSTLRKTVTVPANRLVRLEFAAPENIPPGEAEITLEISTITPLKHGRDILRHAGSLANSLNFSGDPSEVMRKLRDE